MQIRPYRPGDRAELAAFWKQAFPNDPPHNEPGKVIEAKLAVDDLIFVATEQDKIIGAVLAGYDGHRGWLYLVAVDEVMRRKGIGGRLVRHVVDVLTDRGCIKINLQVRSTNSAVVAFYRSLGFKVEDRISMGLFRGKEAQQVVPADVARPAGERRG